MVRFLAWTVLAVGLAGAVFFFLPPDTLAVVAAVAALAGLDVAWYRRSVDDDTSWRRSEWWWVALTVLGCAATMLVMYQLSSHPGKEHLVVAFGLYWVPMVACTLVATRFAAFVAGDNRLRQAFWVCTVAFAWTPPIALAATRLF
jgi:peptidoglycan biosynthesis protein MviN/MurJ (putative lipid II flippase)